MSQVEPAETPGGQSRDGLGRLDEKISGMNQ